ncbi:MAG TPA: DUF5666 domain-containing protein, partial [Chloroflexota bacterium]|nr:DUF5666 domain-containing protein [Chloroflexota bacterium]
GGGFRSSSNFGGAASGGGGQVAAALALATPPTSGGQLGATGGAPAPAGKAGSASGATGTAGSGAAGAPAAGATATDVAGTLQSIDGQSVKVKTTQGAVRTLALGAATTYYRAETASASALKVGQKVTLSLQPNSSGGFGAGSVTIAPPGSLYGYVHSAVPAGGGGSQGGGLGAGGAGGGFGFSLAATLTAVSSNSITAANATGRSFTIALKSSTPIYQLALVASTKLAPGAMVSVHAGSVSGKLVAENVVASNLQGMVASLTTQQARRRAGFGGGGAGGGGGFGGAGTAGGGAQGG